MSPDDDGLEPVYPTQPSPAPAGYRSARPVAPRAPGRASESVVVDPSSQVPSSPKNEQLMRRRAEATLVLEGRRVDKLREEVVKQQQRLKRRRRSQMIYWAFAGAAAVLIGGALASGADPGGFFSRFGEHEADLTELSLDPAPSFPERLQEDAHTPRRAGVEAHPSGGELPPAGSEPAQEPEPEPLGHAQLAATAPSGAPRKASNNAPERAPGEPKIAGNWGDGLDRPGPSSRPVTEESGLEAPQKALSLDDLEEE